MTLTSFAQRCGAPTRATDRGPIACSPRPRRAWNLFEPLVAERLARAALEADPSAEASYLLGEALSDQNRADEAFVAFRAARELPGTDRVRAAAAMGESSVLYHQLGRFSDAQRVLREAQEQVTDVDARRILDGALLAKESRPNIDPDELSQLAPSAALRGMIEYAARGQIVLAIRIGRERLETASEWNEEFPTIEMLLRLTTVWALALGGWVYEAQTEAEAAYAAAVHERAEYPRVAWSLARAASSTWCVACLDARDTSVVESAAVFDAADRGLLRPTRAYLCMAAGNRG